MAEVTARHFKADFNQLILDESHLADGLRLVGPGLGEPRVVELVPPEDGAGSEEGVRAVDRHLGVTVALRPGVYVDVDTNDGLDYGRSLAFREDLGPAGTQKAAIENYIDEDKFWTEMVLPFSADPER